MQTQLLIGTESAFLPYPWRLVTEILPGNPTQIGPAMLVRLTAKLAEVVNGVDLSRYREGDVVELPERECQMLVAERWAELVAMSAVAPAWRPDAQTVADDRKRRRHR